MNCCCGAHISLGDTLHSTVCSMDKGNSDAIQVFYGGTMNYNTYENWPKEGVNFIDFTPSMITNKFSKKTCTN